MLKLDHHLALSASVCTESNLCAHFTERDLSTIGSAAWDGYNADQNSRAHWLTRMQGAMELALQVQKSKSFPWPDCANVAFPLITIATLQFHARAYPTMFEGPDIVKYRVPGVDTKGELAQRAQLVARYMSYQCLDEDEAFEEQHDRLLINVPIVGCAFIKTRRDQINSKNSSTLVLAQDLVIDYYAKSVDGAARKTQIIPFSRNEIHEKCVAGTWRNIRDEKWYDNPFQPIRLPQQGERDNVDGKTPPTPDDATPILFGEQHCWLDLDDDGYAEPYIVTFDLTNKFVVRIVARWERPEDIERIQGGEVLRINATEYYTKYGLIPAPDGSIYDLGFGILLGPLNESVNTLVNQLMDAGTMQVAAGGFLSRGVKIRGGAFTFQPFGWQRVDSTGDDLSKGIFPLPVREPSQVLYQLLVLLINYTQRISGSGDTLVGENPGQNTPANNMNVMVEQGMKIYSAIFKRIWRSMRDEFRKLYILNARYLAETVPFGEGKVGREMFLEDPSKLVPSADPNLTTETARVQQAAAIKQGSAMAAGYDRDEVERNWLRSLRVDNIDAIFPGSEKMPPPPDLKLQLKQLDVQIAQAKLQSDEQQFALELQEEMRVNSAKIANLEAQAQSFLAAASGEAAGHDIAMLDAALGALKAHQDGLKLRHDVVNKRIELALKKKEIDNKPAPAAA